MRPRGFGDSLRDTAAARAKVEHANFALPYPLYQFVGEYLRFHARYEHVARNLYFVAVKFAFAQNVVERFARKPFFENIRRFLVVRMPDFFNRPQLVAFHAERGAKYPVGFGLRLPLVESVNF